MTKPISILFSASLLALGINAATAAQPAPAQSQVQAFLTVLSRAGGKPIEQLPVPETRKVLSDAQAGAKLPPAEVSEQTIQVDGKPLTLNIVKPDGAGDKPLPVLMFFHGGGWILGDFPTHERLVWDLVNASGAAAVFVNYSPSPEAHYPVAVNQAYAATCWVAEHGGDIGVDGARLAVVGNSAGGNMATVVAMMAKEKGAPHIRFKA